MKGVQTGPRVLVACAHCRAELMRRLYRPTDGKKIERFFCGLTCKGQWQREQKPVTAEWLRQAYEVEGRSANDIAREVGRDPKRVWEWLRDTGTATRPRGHDERQYFKPGHKLGVGRSLSDAQKDALRAARKHRPNLPHLIGGEHAFKGKTGPAHPTWKGGLTPERNAFYGSPQWKSACCEVWKRADAKCERCGLDHRSVDRSAVRFHVHHIVSFMCRELRAEPSNLALLCQSCHRWVHSRQNATKQFIGEYHAVRS